MTAKIIDGKTIAAQINQQTAQLAADLKDNHQIQPGLAVVLIGDNPASKIYVNSKVKLCANVNIASFRYELPGDSIQEQVLALIDELNNNPAIHGILVQSPPPPQIDEGAVVEAIDPDKDVDCFHARNVGKMLLGETDGFFPCTPWGVMQLLKYSNIDPAGKHAVIIGRSNIVGKPMMALLVQKAAGANATVTCVHSGTPDLAEHTRRADLLIAAIGKPEFVKASMVKPGATVIDVGINRVNDPDSPKGYKVVGDVAFEEVSAIAGAITPVPGGVGPMTLAILMQNTVKAAAKKIRHS